MKLTGIIKSTILNSAGDISIIRIGAIGAIAIGIAAISQAAPLHHDAVVEHDGVPHVVHFPVRTVTHELSSVPFVPHAVRVPAVVHVPDVDVHVPDVDVLVSDADLNVSVPPVHVVHDRVVHLDSRVVHEPVDSGAHSLVHLPRAVVVPPNVHEHHNPLTVRVEAALVAD